METQIEKAKQQHQVGEIKIGSDGIKRVWTQLANGSYDWRRVKKDKPSKQTTSGKKEEHSVSKNNEKPDVQTQKQQTKQTKTSDEPEGYNKPKAKIQYKKAPFAGAYFYVPETFYIGRQLRAVNRDSFRKTLQGKTDKELLDEYLNKDRDSNIRMLAYEEAASRGIPENKIDVRGSLEKEWKKLKYKKDLETAIDDDDEDTEVSYNISNLRGMDVNAFLEKNFPNGDTGWINKDNPIISKEFDFDSLTGRQRYDAFVDFVKRSDPLYSSPKGQMQQLNGLYLYMMDETFKHPNDHSPMLVSAGAPGAGKTTGLLKVADDIGLKLFDDKKHTPGGTGYEIYMVKEDIESAQDFNKILSEHNGKVILFDDNDKLLTTTKSELVKMMKRILDDNPKMRKFHNTITGKEDVFTGMLIFTTNKTMDKLMDNPDHLAIMSRGVKSDVHFTINETIDLLRDRYKKIGRPMSNVSSPKEEQDIREEVFNMITNLTDRLDPDKFTVRTFENALTKIDEVLGTNKKIGSSSTADALFGKKKRDWRRELPNILTKSDEYDIEKALPPYSFSKDLSVFNQFKADTKDELKKMYEKDPKNFIEMYGKEFVKFITSEKPVKSGKIEKGISVDFDGMSFEEAENILFG